ncbi:hypothetical protein JCM21900_003677 [Sporobolomyces salmonicolor]
MAVSTTAARATGQFASSTSGLLPKGYNHCPGFDFRQTFAPVAKFTLIRIFLTLALTTQQRMPIQQVDSDKVTSTLTSSNGI